MEPPFGPNLINIGGLAIRLYAVCILSGALLGALLGSYRAKIRGYNPQHAWDGLVLGLVLGVAGARTWYVASSWTVYKNKPILEIINPQQGGIAIHGAIVGAMLAVLIYTYWHKLNTLDWLDIMAPCLSVGQALGRWGNFFNREAYGGPVDNGLPWNLNIPDQYRIGSTRADPPGTLYHPTFLYESLWNIGVLVAILWIERRYARRLRRGDSLLIYGVLYSIGRFWIEALRVDKLCTTGITGADCGAGLSTARLTSLIAIGVCILLFVGRRLIVRNPPASSLQPIGNVWQPAEPVSAEAAG